ncbi:insulinase family protein [Marivirga sp. S37H4]|uniref:Insulinase family protein n=1 Tax=Marivirga aurantiaca TaxID=2802615 RepID=A0A935CBV9_9BACT|nr:pitrilysin family protein [Marivirga aurantiaca]MBK6267370.1 insulinase family protein [Marivirga aurantiaca]
MLDRTQAPEAYMLDDLALTKPSITKLKNNLEIHCLTDDTNPVIKIDYMLPFGKVNDQVPGQAYMSAKLLTEGTKSYPAEVLQNTLDHYGAHLDVTADYDHTTISLLCLKEYITPLLPLLKSIITEPLLDVADFDKLKYQQIQKVRVNAQKNALIATKLLRNNLLKGTNYGVVLEEEHLNKLKLQDVTSFYEDFYSRQPKLVIAGEVSEEVIGLIDDYLGTLKFEVNEVTYTGKLTPDYEETIFQKTGSVQASLRMGTLSIPKSNNDYFALSIANEILGGYFGSRLMKNIREDKGYTYGISSMVINYKHEDYHLIGADVKLAHVDDAVAEIYKEMEDMQQHEVSQEELETVKNYMLGKLAGHLDTIFSQADNYKSKLSEGIDFQNYFDAYVHAIRTISASRIQEISKKYFSKEYCVVKVV